METSCVEDSSVEKFCFGAQFLFIYLISGQF